MQTFNQLFFKKKQIFSYFFKEISEYIVQSVWKCRFFYYIFAQKFIISDYAV